MGEPAAKGRGPEAGPERESVRELVSELAENSAALVRAEIALVRQEIREDLAALRTGLVAIAAGALLTILGIVTLSDASVAGLAARVGPFYAGLLVGGVLVLAGAVLVLGGGRRMGRIHSRPGATSSEPRGKRDG